MQSKIESLLAPFGLEACAPALEACDLEKETLVTLTDAELKGLGFTDSRTRIQLLAAFSSISQEISGVTVAGWHTTSDPAAATLEVPFMNAFNMIFVPIPRYKTLFSIIPMRVCDYTAFCEENGVKVRPCDYPQGEDHPLVNVTWGEATRFCEWITIKEQETGVLSQDYQYRLPTDTEWSAAVGLPPEPQGSPKARSGKTVGYPWGNAFPPPRGAGNYHALLKADDFPETSPVASFPPNAMGLYDMGGNVWEWCRDPFDSGSELRVARGASCFNDSEDFLRSSYRERFAHNKFRNNIGFRVAVSGKFSKDPLHRLTRNPWA